MEFIISDIDNQNIWQNTYQFSNRLTWNFIDGIYYPNPGQNSIKISFIGYPYNSSMGNLIDNVNLIYLDCLPVVPSVSDNTVVCNSSVEQQITVSHLVPQDQIVWSTGETTPNISVTESGSYTVTITRQRGGCAPLLVFVKEVVVTYLNTITSQISFN